MSASFRVGVTRDFLTAEGKLSFGDIGLGLLDEAMGVEWEFLPEKTSELRPDQIEDYDGLLVLGPAITSASLAGVDRLAIVARFGVGYDQIDVEALTASGVILTITPDGVRRPIAVAAITYLLALSHKLLIKDRLTRLGRWDDKLYHMGMGVTGRTLGLVGFGNIGREIVRLAEPFGMHHLTYDPYITPEKAKEAGVESVNLERLLRVSDYVVIVCALTPETRHLINRERLTLMKTTGYLINVARGPIVDGAALADALREGVIAGAGLDVFEQEPVDPADPLLKLENVIVAPHGLGWTDECFFGNGASACRSLIDVARGQIPQTVVNRVALDSPLFGEKLARYKANTQE